MIKFAFVEGSFEGAVPVKRFCLYLSACRHLTPFLFQKSWKEEM